MQVLRRLMSGAPVAVVDSAVSSASNFLLSGAALALLDAGAFAAISLVQAAHVILLALNRSGYFEALLIRRSSKEDASAAFDGAAALTASTISASIVGLIVLAVGLATSSTLLVVFAAGIVPLVVADSMRFLAFAEQLPERALRVDVAWLVTQIALLVAMVLADLASAPAILATWCIGALVGCAAGTSFVSWSNVRAFRDWIGIDSDIRPGLVIDAIAARAAPAVSLFLVAAVLPVQEVALVSGPRSLFGPVNILFTAAMSVGLAAAAASLFACGAPTYARPACCRDECGHPGARWCLRGCVRFAQRSIEWSRRRPARSPVGAHRGCVVRRGVVDRVWRCPPVAREHCGSRPIAARRRLAPHCGYRWGCASGGAIGALIGQLISRWLAVGAWAVGSRGLQIKGGADVAVA